MASLRRCAILFERIVGNVEAVKSLRRSIAEGTLAHAYLFAGPRSTGRFTTALEVAKALNCTGSKRDGCGECSACKRIEERTHPDLIIVEPSDEGALEIGIESIRSMQYLVNLRPREGRTKVCIIDAADRINSKSANALLKTLEEPPKDSLIILIAERPGLLLPTVVSRCRIVRFSALPVSLLQETLERRYSIEPSRARFLAHFSSGRIGEALDAAGGEKADEKNRVIDAVRTLAFFGEERGAGAKERLREDLDLALGWFRDLLMARCGMQEEVFLNIDRIEDIRRDAQRFPGGSAGIIEAMGAIMAAERDIDYNANTKLALGVLEMRMRERLTKGEKSHA